MASTTNSWPNLVGKDGNEAVELIKQATGFTNVQVLPQGSIATMEYRTDRVRVYVDAQGKVVQAPTVG